MNHLYFTWNWENPILGRKGVESRHCVLILKEVFIIKKKPLFIKWILSISLKTERILYLVEKGLKGVESGRCVVILEEVIIIINDLDPN